MFSALQGEELNSNETFHVHFFRKQIFPSIIVKKIYGKKSNEKLKYLSLLPHYVPICRKWFWKIFQLQSTSLKINICWSRLPKFLKIFVIFIGTSTLGHLDSCRKMLSNSRCSHMLFITLSNYSSSYLNFVSALVILFQAFPN